MNSDQTAIQSTRTYLDFERPIAELDSKIDALRTLNGPNALDVSKEVVQLQDKANKQLKSIYAKLGPWEKTQVARHPNRPHFSHYIKGLVSDFTPLSGDRKFGDDNALIGGLGKIKGQSIVIMGHEKGHDTNTRLQHNFGMANPEGYRKAVRLMELAERFSLPVIPLLIRQAHTLGAAQKSAGKPKPSPGLLIKACRSQPPLSP